MQKGVKMNREGNYKKGRKGEYEVINKLREKGYIAVRTAGSHGPFDVIAIKNNTILLIQVKTGKGPVPKNIGREIASLKTKNNMKVYKELWIKPHRKKFVVLSADTPKLLKRFIEYAKIARAIQ